LINTRITEKVAFSSDHVYWISPGYKDDVALPFFGPESVNLIDGDYYVLSMIRDVPDSKENVRVSNIVGFHAEKYAIQSPYQITRSDIPEAVLKNIDAEIDRIRQETPVSGDNQW
jgi:hypothetical protein